MRKRHARKLRSGRHRKYGTEYALRRNAPSWARRHPGQDGWQLSPPLPGTQVGQDIYVAKTKPAAHGFPEMRSMFALFATRARALRGNPLDTLATYDDPIGVVRIEQHYGDVYRFHRLVSVRPPGTCAERRSRCGAA